LADFIPPRQLDLFEDSRNVILRNGVIAALSQALFLQWSAKFREHPRRTEVACLHHVRAPRAHRSHSFDRDHGVHQCAP